MLSITTLTRKSKKPKLMSDNDRKKKKGLVSEISQNQEINPKNEAISMMGMLKRDEEALTLHIKDLLKYRKDYAKTVFTTDVEGWTPFHAFALRGCRKLVKFSLKAGVEVDLEMGQPEGLPGGCSALHLASHRGDVSIIDILITNGAAVNKKDNSDRTPIFYASRASNTLAMKKLARAGADVSLCDPDHKASIDDLPPSPFCFLPFVGQRRKSDK
ncbi:serine/threonine-protein phosphatase 6 regulatory ankyrin repeat subunit B-like [Mizuhopecten yessoensis]|uniref:Serine/threonine-protein phosphatase 6 regulatory ankyrin repeat subunit B n=1 Tax=Mizuhopecten yessoensis TaxID=6573 RepID=A0A210PPW7_MIZYE|nr:serine/threonine-protein phosphatase 6 regulatory ankyrin repeat subunit B-like [Mizuhopecten yessoensis]XP_021378167.1 serine/threonine-protein phosphatase 6 regulatory ankyrin repeat subunit B-like [Mizuhopecten yessoensis]XP_021378168.1 serine/threonine-protein phosphatase 6 regulatory ankyrin repeat subunit B-like [Mizuhopecten yessoensis]XP_021378169.1 serine/threonine-protein phosphatase 6 regulatory ankyrin repeat subunit B-like [Mizuhopecten yessoensis]XP_021378170.1 serine/threonine